MIQENTCCGYRNRCFYIYGKVDFNEKSMFNSSDVFFNMLDSVRG